MCSEMLVDLTGLFKWTVGTQHAVQRQLPLSLKNDFVILMSPTRLLVGRSVGKFCQEMV
jgi:hypothetical protein